MKTFRISALMVIALAAACGGDSKSTADATKAAADSAAAANPAAAHRDQQKAFADSILNAAAKVNEVAGKLGKGYAVGSVALRDSVAQLANLSTCFGTAKRTDPYLAGYATFWVNMGIIGSDVIRVQESKWTSVVGDGVTACLNDAAKSWKFDPTFGKPMAYLVQVVFR